MEMFRIVTLNLYINQNNYIAFDAGYAAALGKSIITLHPPSISHMLKEVNASSNVVCEDPSQVVDTLAYVIEGSLPSTPRDGDLFVPFADRVEI